MNQTFLPEYFKMFFSMLLLPALALAARPPSLQVTKCPPKSCPKICFVLNMIFDTTRKSSACQARIKSSSPFYLLSQKTFHPLHARKLPTTVFRCLDIQEVKGAVQATTYSFLFHFALACIQLKNF